MDDEPRDAWEQRFYAQASRTAERQAKSDNERPWFLRRAHWWIGPLVVLVLIGGIYAWQALQPDERSTGRVETQIQKWADEKTEGGGAISVRCPDPIEWRVGATFHCIIEQDDQSVSVTVSMENDAGDVTWRTE